MSKYLYALIALGFMSSVSAQPQTLSDNEITEVLETINEGEIEAGQMAESQAKNKDVKNFAKMMVNEHKKNDRELEKLAEDNNLDTEDSELSESLESQIEKETANLKNKKDEEFDKAYIAHQVSIHEKALDTIKNELLPNAKSPALRTHLEKTQASVSGHLSQAKEIQSKVQ